MSKTATDTEQVVRDYVAWENGDSSKKDVVAESIDVYNPGLPNGEVHSRAGWEAYDRKVKEGFPDFHVQIEELVASEDVAMTEVRITGTHEGEFKGLPPTGREVEVLAMSLYLIENGKVVEVRQYYDTAELQAELGLTFPAVLRQLPKLLWRKLRTYV